MRRSSPTAAGGFRPDIRTGTESETAMTGRRNSGGRKAPGALIRVDTAVGTSGTKTSTDRMDGRMRKGREGGSLPGGPGGKTTRMMTAMRADTRILTMRMAGRSDVRRAVRSAGLQKKRQRQDGTAGRTPMDWSRSHPAFGTPMERSRNQPAFGAHTERSRNHPAFGAHTERRGSQSARQEGGSPKRVERAALSCALSF